MQLLKCAVGFHEQFSCGMTLKKFILGGWKPLVVPILWPPTQNHGHPTGPSKLEVLEPPLLILLAVSRV